MHNFTHHMPISQCSMPRCCPRCARESTPSGMTRHRKTCKIYQQFMDAGVRLAQYAEHTNSMARRTALQAKQQVFGVEEADAERMQTDITVSFAFIVSTQMVLICHSPLALVEQTLTCLTQNHRLRVPQPLSRLAGVRFGSGSAALGLDLNQT